MNRNLFAAVALALVGFGYGAKVRQEASPPQFRYGDLRISGVGSQFNVQTQKTTSGSQKGGTFWFVGAPRIHAEMPSRKLTIDGKRIDGTFNNLNVVTTATITGPVHGTTTMKSDYGPEPLTFDGDKVVYSQRGSASAPTGHFDISGGLRIHVENSAPEDMTMTGSSGVVDVANLGGDNASLSSADINGPVVLDFAGVMVDAQKHKSRSKFHVTGDHLKVTRGGDGGADYLLELSGNVSIHGTGSTGQVDLKTSSITVVTDKDHNFKSLSGDPDPAATSGTIKQSSR